MTAPRPGSVLAVPYLADGKQTVGVTPIAMLMGRIDGGTCLGPSPELLQMLAGNWLPPSGLALDADCGLGKFPSIVQRSTIAISLGGDNDVEPETPAIRVHVVGCIPGVCSCSCRRLARDCSRHHAGVGWCPLGWFQPGGGSQPAAPCVCPAGTCRSSGGIPALGATDRPTRRDARPGSGDRHQPARPLHT